MIQISWREGLSVMLTHRMERLVCFVNLLSKDVSWQIEKFKQQALLESWPVLHVNDSSQQYFCVLFEYSAPLEQPSDALILGKIKNVECVLLAR